jgi:hypothetical protein
MIHLIKTKATPQQMTEMLETLTDFVKLAVDIERGVLAGGGAMHADCEAVLLADGSEQENIWGADWIPASQQVRYESLINIAPRRGNFSMTIQSEEIREQVKAISETLLGGV